MCVPIELVSKYLDAWLLSWTERTLYKPSQLMAIKSCLLESVMQRYVKTGEMSFTKSELKRAIAFSKETILDSKPVENRDVNPICSDYVRMFLVNRSEFKKYDKAEIGIIRTILYSFVINRYKTSNMTVLKITKQELRHSIEFIEDHRSKKAREKIADERDRKIRNLRSRYGSHVENRVIVHS